jgi:hypothetical protein
MIQDLSQTLKAILTQAGLPSPLSSAQIAFDRPTETFAPTPPALDLFLYDLRENVELRSSEPTVRRSNGEATITPPPLRLACSYMVTAWPAGTGDVAALQEHQLLSQALQVLSQYPTIPAQFLKGTLVGQDPPLPMVALHPDALKNLSEFWTSLGNKLRASLTVTVTIGMPVFPPVTAPIVITEEVDLEKLGLPAAREAFFRIGGQVADATKTPLAGATVTLVERNLTTTTDADGRYTLGPIPQGSYTLLVQSGVKTQKKTIAVPAAASQNYNVQLS